MNVPGTLYMCKFKLKKTISVFIISLNLIITSVPALTFGRSYLAAPGNTEVSDSLFTEPVFQREDSVPNFMIDTKPKKALPSYKEIEKKKNIRSSYYLTPKWIYKIIVAFKEDRDKENISKLNNIFHRLKFSLTEREDKALDRKKDLAFYLLRLSILTIFSEYTEGQRNLIVKILEENKKPLGFRIIITKPGFLHGAQSARYNVKPTWVVIDGEYAQALNEILKLAESKDQKDILKKCGFKKPSEVFLVVGHLFAERWLIHELGHHDMYAMIRQQTEENRVAIESEWKFFEHTSLNMKRMINSLFIYLDTSGREDLKKKITGSNRFKAFAQATVIRSSKPIDEFVEKTYPHGKEIQENALAMSDHALTEPKNAGKRQFSISDITIPEYKRHRWFVEFDILEEEAKKPNPVAIGPTEIARRAKERGIENATSGLVSNDIAQCTELAQHSMLDRSVRQKRDASLQLRDKVFQLVLELRGIMTRPEILEIVHENINSSVDLHQLNRYLDSIRCPFHPHLRIVTIGEKKDIKRKAVIRRQKTERVAALAIAGSH